MKANEAPEKIYVNFHFTETHPGHSPMVTKQGVNKYDVVYVRIDAFIDKATEWLEKNADKYIWYSDYAEHPGDDTCGMDDDFINDFKNHMKGE